MKKRILSLALALVMCFSMFTFSIAVEAATLGELMEIYKERVWDWQENQFNAMTDEQKAVIDAAWASYDAKRDDLKGIAEGLVDEVLENNTTFYETETMKDLYKWKLMRDLMESAKAENEEDKRIDATSDDEAYLDWLARFTEFEEANDEAISASAPMAALNGLGDYSDDLTVYFGELAEMAVVDGFAFEGTDADKANAYLAAYDYATKADDMASIHDDLVADVKDLMVEGLVNGFDIGMQLATNQVNRDNTTGVFDMIADRDMKAAFLLVGEDVVEYALDLVPGLRGDIVGLDKTEIMAAVIGDATPILGGNNEAAADALYVTMKNLTEYMLGTEENNYESKIAKIDIAEEYIEDTLGIEAKAVYGKAIDALESAMAEIEAAHGLELVHLNTFFGRELLRYEEDGEYVYLNGAEIDGDTVTELALGFGHSRYPVFSSMNDYGIASFDANYDADGIKVYAGEGIGELVIEVAEEADGEATVNVYRGYTDDDMDGTADFAEDVYRYVTSFKVTATSDVVVEDPYVELDDVANTTVDGTIEVKGTTNLDYVTVAVVKTTEDGLKTIYAVVYSKAEFEAGITLEAPDAAVEGEVYTVVVGTEKASDSDEFEIEGAEEEYEVVLEDVADVTVDGILTVKGTTNLDYVTVSIVKTTEDGLKTIYAVVYSKAEFEAGIALEAPDAAVVGEVYTVVVGTEKASDSDEFEIIEDEADYEVELEDVADVTVDGTITVKGTTNLDYVTVAVVKTTEDGLKTIYAVVYTKAEFEAGIEIAAPDAAVVGEVYTVVVGTEKASDSDEFEIIEDVTPPAKPTLALAGKDTRTVTKNKTITITTTPQNVPEGSVAEVVWTTEDGEIVEVTELNGDANNIATVKGLKKGTATLTATLYVDGVATDASVTVTVKVTTGGGTSGGTVYTNITVKVDETKDVVKVPAGGVNVEFTGTGDGEVKVEIVDGVVVVTGIKEGTVKGTVKVTNESGRTVLTGDYKFTVTEGDVVTPDHKCEWPDIAATATKDAHWAHETIDIMTINGYIKGYEDGTFKPDQNITRAEFSAIVYRILGLEVAEDGVLYDDTVGHWAEDIVATMSLPEGYGMLRGYGDGNFGPNDNITREQAVAIIARAKSAVWVAAEEGAKDVFTDAEDISWWFDGEMDAAVTNGLITGYEDGSYKPKSYTTRAEACVLLARAWPEVLE